MDNIFVDFKNICKNIKSKDLLTLQKEAFISYFKRLYVIYPDGVSLGELMADFDGRKIKEFVADSSYFLYSIEDLKKNIDQYVWLYGKLEDTRSKNVLSALLYAKLYIDNEALSYAFDVYSSEYFITDIFEFGSQEVLVDGGAYDGDTAIEFMNICPNFRKMYLFEPIEDAKEKMREKLSEFNQENSIEFFENALSSRREYLRFNSENGEACCIDCNGGLVIEAVTIDEVVKEHVTFLKLDIEGMEAEAIEGGKKIIKRDTPKLAICIYHKPDDFWKISQAILDIQPNYALKIRQHSPAEFCETILYGVPSAPKMKNEGLEVIGKRIEKYRMALTDDKRYQLKNLFEHRRQLMRMVTLELIDKERIQKEIEERKKIHTIPVFYFDTGLGFSESQKSYGTYTLKNGRYVTYVKAPKNTINLRFDPALCGQRSIKFTDLEVNGRCIEYESFNILEMSGSKLLVMKYPYLVWRCTSENNEIVIDLSYMTSKEMDYYLEKSIIKEI